MWWRQACCALLALHAGLGCGGGTPPPPTTLVLAVRADVTGIFPNPPSHTESHTFDVNANVFEGLVRFNRELIPEPALADRWENPDEVTWIFHLRPGARFSNGEPVQPGDVVASLLAARQRAWITDSFLQTIESVTEAGPDAVRIRTRAPNPVLLPKLHYGFVLPARLLGQSPIPTIGTGPYALERWVPGHELVLARNPHFWGRPGLYEKLRFLVVPDPKERIRVLVEGKAQVADQIPLAEVDSLSRLPEIRVVARSGMRVLFLCLRMNQPPFSDPRVREALDLAIDREELVRRALLGKAVVASQIVTPSVSGYDPAIAPSRPDQQRARKLLAEAGFSNGLTVRLDGPNNRYANDSEILAEVARQLEGVGIHIQVNALPKEKWFALLGAGQSSFYLLGWACESRDAADILDGMAHSVAAGGFGSNNYQGLSDAVLDRLITEADGTGQVSLRKQLLAQAVARVAALRAMLPLTIQTETIALSSSVRWEPPINFGLRLFAE